MSDEKRRLNILLIEDSSKRLRLVRDALEQSATRCRLHSIGPGTEVFQYLRQEAHYTEVPKPDLVLFDFSQLEDSYFSIIDQLRSSPAFRYLPLALLTRPDTEAWLEEEFESSGACAVFSPIELDEFLRTMNSRPADRFVNAISLIAKLGIVLVRAPVEFADDSEEQASTKVA